MDALKPYLATHTDSQITEATGLHQDNLRRLITWRGRSGSGWRGPRRIRLWSTTGLAYRCYFAVCQPGYSLQMAHAYLLLAARRSAPSMMRCDRRACWKDWYPSRRGKGQFVAMTSDKDFDSWPYSKLGVAKLVVDRKYLYSDVRGAGPCLHAIIDEEKQLVYPQFSPHIFGHSSGLTEEYALAVRVDARSIDRSRS